MHGEARHGPNIKEGEDTRQEQERFVVYLAYQPVENITSAKIMAETVGSSLIEERSWKYTWNVYTQPTNRVS